MQIHGLVDRVWYIVIHKGNTLFKQSFFFQTNRTLVCTSQTPSHSTPYRSSCDLTQVEITDPRSLYWPLSGLWYLHQNYSLAFFLFPSSADLWPPVSALPDREFFFLLCLSLCCQTLPNRNRNKLITLVMSSPIPSQINNAVTTTRPIFFHVILGSHIFFLLVDLFFVLCFYLVSNPCAQWFFTLVREFLKLRVFFLR